MQEIKISIPGRPLVKQSARFRTVFPAFPKVLGTLHSEGKPLTPLSTYEMVQRLSFISSRKLKAVEEAEKNIKLVVKSQLPSGFKIHDGPVYVKRMIFAYAPLKSFRKREKQRIEAGETIIKTTAPDLMDNLKKGIFDAMEGVVYTNDSRIFAEENTRKIFYKRPGTWITLELYESEEEYQAKIYEEIKDKS